MRKLVPAILFSLFLFGCGGSDSETTASQQAISGVWVGTATSDISGGFINISLTFSQSGANISGTLSCSSGTSSCAHSTGSISGTISGSDLTIGITWPDDHSCGTFNGVISGNVISGEYSCTDPLGDDKGVWTADKQ